MIALWRLTGGAIVAAALLSGPAAAGETYSAGGRDYTLRCTRDGYELTPVGRGDKLYLGRSCDAFQKRYGSGAWCWANGGFVASFKDRQVGFGRQELRCEPPATYGDACRC